MYEIKTHPSSDPRTPDFYVQTVGTGAGRPMLEPSANCWAVYTSGNLHGKYFYYVVLNAFNQGVFSNYLRGTAIPYLTMDDFYTLF